MPEPTENAGSIAAAIEPLRADPAAAAILLDLDGTLAPIVARPEEARVPERARGALEPIVERYGLTAIVTGRPPLVAREIAGLSGIAYAGNHGFELLRPGEDEAAPAPALDGHADDARLFLAGQDLGELRAAEGRIEDKGPIVALHWRGAVDERAAEAIVDGIARRAEAAGLVTHRGRKIVELRPPVRIDKGDAVTGLLEGSGVRAALYAGDDRTDLDAFDALERLRETGALDRIVRVGVASEEGPPEIAERADLVLESSDSVPALLEALAS